MTKFPFKPAAFAAMLLVAVPIGSSAAQAAEKEDFVRYGDFFPEANFPMTAIERKIFVELQKYLERIRKRGPKSEAFLPGLKSTSLLSVQISDKGNVLVNLSDELNPKEEFIGDIELFHRLTVTTQDTAQAVLKDNGVWDKLSDPHVQVFFVFNGKTAFPGHYRTRDNRQSPAPLKKSELNLLPNDIVVVSAGHGSFKFYPDATVPPVNPYWKFQRKNWHGVLEDENNPNFATKLRNALVSRSQATVIYARDHENTVIDPESELPWWKVSARYYLKRILPSRPDIWDTAKPYPDKSNSGLEERDDIRSRPLYANYLGAQALFSAHSDGDEENFDLSGTRIYYNPAKASQEALAINVECYVGEILKWFPEPNFQPWTVTRHPTPDKGELNLADMPTVIVEAGFHTNPKDAGFLLNPDFQRDVMRGVEKGWRLFTEGKPCKPFGLGFHADITGTHRVVTPVSLAYSGYPRFPVTAEFVVSNCPPGFDCTTQISNFTNPVASPLAASYKCRAPVTTPTTKFLLDIRLIDADGIKTVIQRPQMTCVKP